MRHIPSISALLAALLACCISGADRSPLIVSDGKKETLEEVVKQRKEIEELKHTFRNAREDINSQRIVKVRTKNGRRIIKDCRVKRDLNMGDHASVKTDSEAVGR